MNDEAIEPIVEFQPVSAIESIERANVDLQISTAKKYPRHLKKVTENIVAAATMDEETAESCFYTLKRQGKIIRGPSVRLAEIAASMYQNLKMGAMIVANNGKTITARGFCQDLENNISVAVEVDRRITDKYGKTYSEDMQVVTGNAAKAIALRNAVLKVVPGIVTTKAYNEARRVAVGDAKSLADRRMTAVAYFVDKLGVPQEKVFAYLEVETIEEVTLKHLEDLTGLKTALKEGTTTIEESFPNPADESDSKVKSGFQKAAKPDPKKTEAKPPAKPEDKEPPKAEKPEPAPAPEEPPATDEKPEPIPDTLHELIRKEEEKGWEVWWVTDIIPPESGLKFQLELTKMGGETETVHGMGKSYGDLELNVPIPMQFKQGSAGRVIAETKSPLKV